MSNKRAKENNGAKSSPPVRDGFLEFTHPLAGENMKLPGPLCAAMTEINRGKKSFILLEHISLACDPSMHADSGIVRSWLKHKNIDSQDFDVIVWLAVAARSEWSTLPQRTVSQHGKLFQHIAKLCQQLSCSLGETGALYMRGGGHGLQHASVRDLLSEFERGELAEILEQTDCSLDDFRLGVILPNLEDLLERVASAAIRLEKQGPLHSQPNKRGAERGYFARRMAELFMQRYGEQPHEIIAAMCTIALGEATDRELVAKLLK